MQGVVGRGLRLVRQTDQRHPRLIQRFRALAMVARLASANEILPSMASASMSGDYVIDGQILSLDATVLARKLVSHEYLSPAQPNLRSRTFYKVDQANDRWTTEMCRRGAHHSLAVLQDFSLPTVEEDDSPFGIADVKRLIVLV